MIIWQSFRHPRCPGQLLKIDAARMRFVGSVAGQSAVY